MKSNELRVGNWVKSTTDDKYFQITAIDHDKDGYLGYYVEYCDGTICIEELGPDGWCPVSPIELSPEILEKAGFEKTISHIGPFDIEYIDYRREFFVCFLLSDNRGLEVEFWAKHNTINERGYLRIVKYVHQLQNLYFCLVGEELNIKF